MSKKSFGSNTEEELYAVFKSRSAFLGYKINEALKEAMEEWLVNHSQDQQSTHKFGAQNDISNVSIKRLVKLVQHLRDRNYQQIYQIDLEEMIMNLKIGAIQRTFEKYKELLLLKEIIYPLREVETVLGQGNSVYKNRKPKYLFSVNQKKIAEFLNETYLTTGEQNEVKPQLDKAVIEKEVI